MIHILSKIKLNVLLVDWLEPADEEKMLPPSASYEWTGKENNSPKRKK